MACFLGDRNMSDHSHLPPLHRVEIREITSLEIENGGI